MATIKEIIRSFCFRINQPAPTSFVGVSSPTERQLLSIFQAIGDNLRNRPYAWPQLKRGHTFTTATDDSKYQLPGDFYRLLLNNQWDTTSQWPLLGPATDEQMAAQQFGAVGIASRKVYRIIGPSQYLFSTSPYSQRSAGTFEIDPAGSNNTDQLFLGYLSCNWVWPRDWVASTVYAAGDIRTGDGYVYRTAAGGTSGSTRPSHATGSASDGSVTWTVYQEPYLVNEGNAALNDSDLCLFDEDIMVEGMRWAYLKAKGQDYQQERADWDQMVKSAFSRFEGVTRTNLADYCDDDDDWPTTSPGGWAV